MKNIILILSMILAPILGAETRTSPIGDWTTFDDGTGEAKSIVRIYEENGELFGRIVTAFGKDPDDVATKVEGQPKITGLVIIRNLKKDGTKWTGGKVLDPENGKTYDCQIWLDKSGNLIMRGSILFIGRKQIWKPAPAAL